MCLYFKLFGNFKASSLSSFNINQETIGYWSGAACSVGIRRHANIVCFTGGPVVSRIWLRVKPWWQFKWGANPKKYVDCVNLQTFPIPGWGTYEAILLSPKHRTTRLLRWERMSALAFDLGVQQAKVGRIRSSNLAHWGTQNKFDDPVSIYVFNSK